MRFSFEEGALAVTSSEAPYIQSSCLAAADLYNIGTKTTQVQFDYGLGFTEPVFVGGSGNLILLHRRQITKAVENDRVWFKEWDKHTLRRRLAFDREFNTRLPKPPAGHVWLVIVADLGLGRRLRVPYHAEEEKRFFWDDPTYRDDDMRREFRQLASPRALAAYEYARGSA